MTPELTVLALAVILQVVQIALAGRSMTRDVGLDWNAGPRDEPQEFSVMTGRLRRSVANSFEALALFTIAVLVVTLSGAAGSFTAACAWIWLAARILYVPAYAFGWSPWRSVIFFVATAAMLAMLLTALI